MTRAPVARDRGDIMVAATAMVVVLMLGAFALIAAGQAWGERRNVQGVADAAARAAAQVSDEEVRRGGGIDPVAAEVRAAAVVGASGAQLGSVQVIDGWSVRVTVARSIDYAFPTTLPSSIGATGYAVAQRGVTGGG